MKIHRIALTLIATWCSVLASATPVLKLNKPSGIFETGERIEVYAFVSEASSSEPLQFKAIRDNGEEIYSQAVEVSESWQKIYQITSEETVSLIFELSDGESKDAIGAVVAPEGFQPGKSRPKDFDAFWQTQKDLLAQLPMEADMSPIELGEADAGYLAYDVEINAPGPRPARAIFAKPEQAEAGSLPIVVRLRAAGVKGDWCRAQLWEAMGNAKRGGGALSLDLNAHGMLNHEEEDYYLELEEGPLKNYWDQGLESRDEYYFRFMYLRMLRAIEFLTQQPEWDGKRILLLGESQGGGQALAAAGLDPRVSAVVVTVPALCDFGAPLADRKGGWPQPVDNRPDDAEALQTSAYFDAAHLLQTSEAQIVAEIGFIDDTCPASSIFAAINQSQPHSIVYPVPYRGHPWPEGSDRALWDATVAAAKEDFVNHYLK